MTTIQQERHLIPVEPDIQAGRFPLNYKLLWAISLFALSGLVIIISSIAGRILAGLGFAGAVTLFYLLTIQLPLSSDYKTTVLAKAYRNGTHRFHKLVGWSRHSSDQPAAGEVFGHNPPRNNPGKEWIRLIGPVDFYPLRVNTLAAPEDKTPPLGIAHDKRYGTRSAVLWAAGSALSSADSHTQKEQQEAFAHLLDLLADLESPLYRFTWSEQTLMGEPQRPLELIEAIRSGAQLEPREAPNQGVFQQRTAEMGNDSIVHRTTMTLALYDKYIRSQAKAMGSPEDVIIGMLDMFYNAAMPGDRRSPIGLRAASFLTHNQLVLENRLALDPVFAQPIWQQGLDSLGPNDLLDRSNAWPGHADFKPEDYCKLGSTYHMGFYIAEFTRTGVLPDQFWSILKVRVPKRVTVVIEMVPAHRAQRRAEWTTTGAEGANVERVTKNRRVTAFQRVAADAAAQHEAELAENKGQVGRMRCYIDVTGATLDEVMFNAGEIRKACTGARFVLEPLVGRQHLGIEATMPVGRGLASIPLPKWA